ncbi:hypothetical protein [Streptomyces sp. HD]|uniref:hypothetical protein n=1 Tax=Streptomyces sp. HD TaxID=3020892 RepID=UPI00232C9B43|nr:hypothetical protein [Streptomyces sp. HD]MDC0765635.1 hypothetical protein [Streptomyces sp. HD]
MTAENDNREGRTGVDALMAALTDEPLGDEARADAAFMAEHRSAAADVALLREQLEIIGHALAEPPAPVPVPEPEHAPAPAPARVRRPARVRHRIRTVALGSLAVAAAASVLVGLGWLLTHAGSGDAMNSDAGGAADSKAAASPSVGADFGSPDYLACSRLVAEGVVTAVEPVPGTTQERITLRVTRAYLPEKPGKNGDKVTFEMEKDSVLKGEHLLVGIPRDATTPDVWFIGEEDIAPERAWITASLREAPKPTC